MKQAVKLLTYLGMHVDSRSIQAATEVLARGMPGVIRVTAKTVLKNEMCSCLLLRWSTARKTARSRIVSKRKIPASWHDLTRRELMDLAAGFRDERDAEREGRLEAIRKQRDAARGSDPLAGDIARLAALAASLSPAASSAGLAALLAEGEVEGG